MHVNIRCRPAYAIAYLILGYDERVYAERGAMATMSTGVKMKGTLGGDGALRALKRKAFGGESLLFTEFRAQTEGAWVGVAPAYPGDIQVLDISQLEPMMVESGALLAYAPGVSSNVAFTGLRTMAMHEGIALLELQGAGTAVISSYGGIDEVELGAGDEVIVDTGHIVAFSASMRFDVGPLGSVGKSVTSGEGLVAKFTGPGRVLVQTRAEQSLRDWLFPNGAQNTGH